MKHIRSRFVTAVGIYVFLCGLVDSSLVAAEDRIVSLKTRPGVTQDFLILEPEANPIGSVIMFPPEEGLVAFERKNGEFKIKHGGWIGQTVPMYLAKGLTVAVIRPPSDRSDQGMDTAFRKSEAHAEDMRQVIQYLTMLTEHKPFLVATCRATHSAASVAAKLDGGLISGVVLASARSRGKRGSILDSISPQRVRTRLIFVHHIDDDCGGSPYSGVPGLAAAFGVAEVSTLSVSGGWSKADARKQTRGCGENGSHKFYGAHEVTVEAIIGWMAGRRVAKTIDAGN